MTPESRRRMGLGLLLWGSVALIAAVAAGAALAGEMVGHYGAGAVHVRGWMRVHNDIVLAVHIAVLAPIAVGAGLALGDVHGRIARAARAGALICYGAAIAAAAVMLAFPHVAGAGPWSHAAAEVRAMRHLAFAPPVLRAAGFALLVGALTRSRPGLRRGAVILAGALADVALSSWRWWSTPLAVVATLHPWSTSGPIVAVWIAVNVLFVTGVRHRLFGARQQVS